MAPEQQLHHEIAKRAKDLLGRVGSVSVEIGLSADEVLQPGIRIEVPWGPMFVECVSSPRQARLLLAIEQVQALARRYGGTPLVAVPYMTEPGATLCADRGVGWLDASGNAEISTEGLYIHVRGEPNRYKRPGRPASVFATRSSRLTRWLLMHPGARVTQAQLAQATQVDPGMTSRVVRRMEELELLHRHEDGAVSVIDPKLLLDSWAEQYRFDSHHRMPVVLAARSGVDGLRSLVEVLAASELEHAFTGLSAAWQYDQHAMFRLISVFVRSPLAELDLPSLGLHPVEKGANVWLLSPADDAVFWGAQEIDGIHCVSPLQAWLDLRAHPERSVEAADVLLRHVLEEPG